MNVEEKRQRTERQSSAEKIKSRCIYSVKSLWRHRLVDSWPVTDATSASIRALWGGVHTTHEAAQASGASVVAPYAMSATTHEAARASGATVLAPHVISAVLLARISSRREPRLFRRHQGDCRRQVRLREDFRPGRELRRRATHPHEILYMSSSGLWPGPWIGSQSRGSPAAKRLTFHIKRARRRWSNCARYVTM